MIILDPNTLRVESFSAAPAEPGASTPTTQRTYERDCTMPGICPETW